MIPIVTPASQIQALMLETALLAAEAQAVVALRAFKLAGGGPAANAEYYRMYWEKWLVAWSQHAAQFRTFAMVRSEAAAAPRQTRFHRRRVRRASAGSR